MSGSGRSGSGTSPSPLGVEQALVHVDVDDLRAVRPAGARPRAAAAIARRGSASELRRAGDVGAPPMLMKVAQVDARRFAGREAQSAPLSGSGARRDATGGFTITAWRWAIRRRAAAAADHVHQPFVGPALTSEAISGGVVEARAVGQAGIDRRRRQAGDRGFSQIDASAGGAEAAVQPHGEKAWRGATEFQNASDRLAERLRPDEIGDRHRDHDRQRRRPSEGFLVGGDRAAWRSACRTRSR